MRASVRTTRPLRRATEGMRRARTVSTRSMRTILFLSAIAAGSAITLGALRVEAQDLRGVPQTHEQDTNGDGVIDWRLRIWTFGATMRQEVDVGADGSIDELIVATHDTRGAVLSWLVDQHADGTWDRSLFYRYDDAGRRVHAEADLDGDGAADTEMSFDPPCEAPFQGCDVMPDC